MTDTRVERSLANWDRALTRLEEALSVPMADSLVVDGTIQRFEFSFELAWKSLKKALDREGERAGSPRQTLKRAYALGWIDHEQPWLDMLQDRNETAHIYDEAKAREIYQRIGAHAGEMRRACTALSKRLESEGPPSPGGTS